MTYRDPLAGLLGQVVVKRAVLEERERALPPVLRALLPAEMRESMAALRAAASAAVGGALDTLETLAAVDAALDGLLAAHDAAHQQSTRLRWCAEDPGNPPRPWIAPPWLIEERGQLAIRRALDARITILKGDPVERWGDRGYRSHIRIEDARALYFFDYDPTEGGHASVMLRVTVPDSLERITVSPRSLQNRIGRTLGLVRDLQIGAPEFDSQFLVTGAAASTAVLTSGVRYGLLHSPISHLRLSVGRGYATLTWTLPWRGSGHEAVTLEGISVMAGIRRAIADG